MFDLDLEIYMKNAASEGDCIHCLWTKRTIRCSFCITSVHGCCNHITICNTIHICKNQPFCKMPRLRLMTSMVPSYLRRNTSDAELALNSSPHHCCNHIAWCKALHCSRNLRSAGYNDWAAMVGWRSFKEEFKMQSPRVIKLPLWVDVGHGPHGSGMPWWKLMGCACSKEMSMRFDAWCGPLARTWPQWVSGWLNRPAWQSTVAFRPRLANARLQAGAGPGPRGPHALPSH